MIMFLDLILILLFVTLKGFFSGSEIAMVNCDKLKMRHRARQGHEGSKLVLEVFRTPGTILGTTLVGTNISTVAVTSLVTITFIELFGHAGDLISVVVLWPFLLILGEIVPKSIYQQKADVFAPVIIYPLRFFSILFFPIIFIFGRVARFSTRIMGGGKIQNGAFPTREEIRMLLEMSEPSANVSREFDRQRVRRIIRFADTTVGEAMIPLAEVVGVEEKASIEEVVNIILLRGFNRLPVFRVNLTNVVGVLTLDTWSLMDSEIKEKSLAQLVQKPLYISPMQTIDQALPLMQGRSDHMAIVVDEFGSAIGILTMEDIFEEVVGEIDVGYDFDEYHPKRNKAFIQSGEDDEFIVDGRAPMSQINETLHTRFPLVGAHTIAGLILNRLRAIPKVGESIVEQDYRLTVHEADDRSILRVHIKRL